MSGKFGLIVSALLFEFVIAACARPTYVSPGGNARATEQQSGPACAAPMNSGLCVSVAWEKLATQETSGSFLFLIRSGSGLLADPTGNKVKVALWMPAMGHGSAPVQVQRLGTGEYRASDVFFIMPGEWQIKFQSFQNETWVDEAVLPFRL